MTDVTDTTTPEEPSTGTIGPPPEPRFGDVDSLSGLIDKVVTELRSVDPGNDAIQQLADDLTNERGDIAAAVEGTGEEPAAAEESASKASKSSKK